MYVDQFEMRLAKVRHRFASGLEGKIKDAVAATPAMVGNATDVAGVVAFTYRQLHGICGVGPTVGFTDTGTAARAAEGVLIPAFREKRGLTEGEVAAFKKSLDALSAAATSELSAMYQRGG